MKRVVDRRREDPVAVVDDKSVLGIERQTVSKPLYGPLGSGVLGEIPVQYPTRRDIAEDEHVKTR